VHDPLADPDEAMREYGLRLSPLEDFTGLEALIVAVGHKAYRDMPVQSIRQMFDGHDSGLVMDIRGCLDKKQLTQSGLSYWRL
jgi:UDP-N-acetyl-D-galactosamine dehydrogenase